MNFILRPNDSLMSRVNQAQLKKIQTETWGVKQQFFFNNLETQLPNEDIKKMKVKALVKKKTEIAAFKYLCKKQKKGKEGQIYQV